MSTVPVGVFCDFDGTISERDMIGAIGLEFGGPRAPDLIARVQRTLLPVRAGVEAIFAAIPSSRLAAVEAYARRGTAVRAGFEPFVEDALGRGWLFAVVSGGFDFFVRPAVERFGERIPVFCNRLDATGPFLRVDWGVACDPQCDAGCGLCKPAVLRRFRGTVRRQVVIGDGVTDLKAARLADCVVARDRLRLACDREGIRYLPLDSFDGLADRIWEAVRPAAGGAERL